MAASALAREPTTPALFLLSAELEQLGRPPRERQCPLVTEPRQSDDEGDPGQVRVEHLRSPRRDLSPHHQLGAVERPLHRLLPISLAAGAEGGAGEPRQLAAQPQNDVRPVLLASLPEAAARAEASLVRALLDRPIAKLAVELPHHRNEMFAVLPACHGAERYYYQREWCRYQRHTSCPLAYATRAFMLVRMRALPGREIRTTLKDPEAGLNRETVAERQRARIRRATGELVAKRGYNGVSVELIIERARVGYRTFYKHYPNKEAAFADLFDTTVAVTTARVREAMGAVEGEWPEQLAAAIRAFFAAIVAEPLIARACLVEAATASPEVLARYENVTKAFVPILREGRNYEPQAKALPETMEGTLAGATLWSAYQRLIVGEAERVGELLFETVHLLLRPYIGDAKAREVAAATEPI